AYARVTTMLGSRRFCLQMLDLLAFIELGPWTTADDRARRKLGQQALRSTAARTLRRQWKKMREFDRVSRLGPGKRHQLRLRAKTFR
uniref:CHAD domain-containing protein n=1 Tax=Citrobacter freundii TaxID=546 RepID=UPI0019540D26